MIAQEQFTGSWSTEGEASRDVVFPSDVKAGSLLLLLFNNYDDTGSFGPPTVADDNGNSWTVIHSSEYVANRYAGMWYAEDANSGPTTITISFGDNSFIMAGAVEVSGILTTGALDQDNAATATSAAWDSGDITTTEADEYLIGLLVHDSGEISITEDDPPWTLILEEENGSQYMPASASDIIASSTMTEAYTGALGSSVLWDASVASFKAAEVGGVDRLPSRILVPTRNEQARLISTLQL